MIELEPSNTSDKQRSRRQNALRNEIVASFKMAPKRWTMERKNTGQLSLACTENLRDNRQPRRLGSVLPSLNAKKLSLSMIIKFKNLSLETKDLYLPSLIWWGKHWNEQRAKCARFDLSALCCYEYSGGFFFFFFGLFFCMLKGRLSRLGRYTGKLRVFCCQLTFLVLRLGIFREWL